METQKKTVKLRNKYRFEDGIFVPQVVEKYILASFYQKSPDGFRKELCRNINLVNRNHKTRSYTTKECMEIIAEYGTITIDDALNGLKKADNYIASLKNKRKKLKKRR